MEGRKCTVIAGARDSVQGPLENVGTRDVEIETAPRYPETLYRNKSSDTDKIHFADVFDTMDWVEGFCLRTELAASAAQAHDMDLEGPLKVLIGRLVDLAFEGSHQDV